MSESLAFAEDSAAHGAWPAGEATTRLPPGAPRREMRWPAIAYMTPLVLRSQRPLAVVNRHWPARPVSTVTQGTLPWLTRARRQLASIRPPWKDSTAIGRQADCAGT